MKLWVRSEWSSVVIGSPPSDSLSLNLSLSLFGSWGECVSQWPGKGGRVKVEKGKNTAGAGVADVQGRGGGSGHRCLTA